MKAQRKINELFLNEKDARKLGALVSHQRPIRTESFLLKIKNAYKSKFEKIMTAVTFAEAGEFDTARNILNE